MSETLTITGGATGTTYGSFAGATNYHGSSGSDAAVAFRGLPSDDERKRKLIDATRRLNRLGWTSDYATFAQRDALDLSADPDNNPDQDATYPFRAACYELAGLAAGDPSVLTVADQGSNIQSVSGGGASVTYFAPTSAERGTAPLLPPTVMALIGAYLAISEDPLVQDGGTGETGSCSNPFGARRDYERREPY